MTGRVIAGRYNLQHPIGRGAMGVVWRARDQILDRLGYRVTVMAGEASELRLGLNADEELDALLGAVEAEMTLAVALLLLGRGQCHGGLPVTV